ncbi:ATP-dependent nuclease, partial [Lactiplantibacillus plantarum]|uniref:ATP-dependent nuclease n=1 Tax=Lactiplantibacillus plantarum TaxID=1590 RepID=UPI001C734C80
FLTAIRTVMDYRFRNNISENDFFELNTQKVIRIKIRLKIDLDDEDSQHLVSEMKSARTDKGESEFVYVLLVSEWDDQNMMANTEIFWGNDPDDGNLIQVPAVGLNRTQIDSVFDVVYLDSLTDGGKSFNTYRRGIDTSTSTGDEDLAKKIAEKFSDINHLVASAEAIKSAQHILTDEYRNLRQEEANVVIRSEQTMGGFTNNLAPYISFGQDSPAYPAGGDGRKKILAYAVQNALVKQRQNQKSKITVFLIEEPENSLHKGIQKSLSRRLFAEDIYRYFFMTTHSSEIVSEMDRTMLIRISDQRMMGTFYRVPNEFRVIRQGYNAPIAEALFYDKVLIVEGPSEKLLIDAIGKSLDLFPEENGKFVMIAFGIGLKIFFDLLSNYSTRWSGKNSMEQECNELEFLKRTVYENEDTKTLAQNKLFLAKDDLENDMWNVAQNEIEKDIKCSFLEGKDFVKWLQAKKSLHMLKYTMLLSRDTSQKLLDGLDGLEEFFGNDR